jgi:hypothetical protein
LLHIIEDTFNVQLAFADLSYTLYVFILHPKVDMTCIFISEVEDQRLLPSRIFLFVALNYHTTKALHYIVYLLLLMTRCLRLSLCLLA